MGFRTTTRQIQEKANLRNTRTRYKTPIFPRYTYVLNWLLLPCTFARKQYKKLFFWQYFLHFIAKHKRTAQSKWRSFHPKQSENFFLQIKSSKGKPIRGPLSEKIKTQEKLAQADVLWNVSCQLIRTEIAFYPTLSFKGGAQNTDVPLC